MNVYSDKYNNTIILSDILDYIKHVKDNTFDLIIADPPYFQICGEFDFGIFKNKKEYIDWCRQWITECKRILKPTGTLMLWGGLGKKQIMLARIAIMIEDEDILIRQNWITQRNTRGIGTNKNYMSAREDLLFLTKSDNYTFNIPYTDEKSNRKDLGFNGKPRKNKNKRVSNVWCDIAEASQSSIERCNHPTVKAQKLCDRIILTHSNENDSIFIPFSGSGSEVISAIKNNRKVTAVEISQTFLNESVQRIKNMTKIEFKYN